MSLDTTNKYFTLASDLVNYTSKNIFLTGKAGTGKTTFLKHIRQTCAKEMAIIAPTGVAAINAGGSTMHSFFQLPFTPFIPGHFSESGNQEVNNTHTLISKLKINNDKRKLFQALELLIIDEISMVRCDMIDAIDIVLKHYRNSPAPFGGVQVLFIGDMYQLPPVIPEQEWSMLSQYYKSPYFFSSQVISVNEPLFISFEKIYRQNDEKFIELLNAVRNNDLDESHMKCLDALFKPHHVNDKNNQAIVLTTHNSNADSINENELQHLRTPSYQFKAKIEGEFYEKYFPAEELLILKPGAQVMFIKNDTEKIRRYFNGKIGIVKSIEEDKIIVACDAGENVIEVKKEKWENIRYNLNHSTKQIDEDIVGSFTQYPLKLAWAITIHKSQGLTFEKAIIDAGAAFSPGQVYVALSRCTQMEGLILKSKINYNSLKTDQRILEFSRNVSSLLQIESQLTVAKADHQRKILTQLFDISVCYSLSSDLTNFVASEYKAFNDAAVAWSIKIKEQVIALQNVAQKFNGQLQSLFSEQEIPQESHMLQQRVMAASKYFTGQFSDLINIILKSTAVTDSKQLAKVFNDLLYNLFSNLSEKKFFFEMCSNGFDGYNWHFKKKEFKLPPFKVNAYALNSNFINENLSNPQLYHKLKLLRDEICNKTGKPVYLVANSQTITEMCNYLPQNLHELSKINGFGKIRLKEVGESFLNIIRTYCEENNLESLIANKEVKKITKSSEAKSIVQKEKIQKPDTKKVTYDLYKEGKTIDEIANIRTLSPITIENHLAYYVKTGSINIQDIMSLEKLLLIEPLLNENKDNLLAPIKEKLGAGISFGEIKMAVAWKFYQSAKTEID